MESMFAHAACCPFYGILCFCCRQVVFNISAVVLEEESAGSYGWLTWRDIFYIFDMIACAVIVVPVLWSIQHLKEAAEVDGKGMHLALR